MYDRAFFASKLGLAALVSMAAMITFSVLALAGQLDRPVHPVAAAGPAA